MEIDVSKIITIPSDTEIPVHNNSVLTKRPLCADFPENSSLLDRLDGVNVENYSSDLFKEDYKVIDNIDELKKLLSELLVRFDTNPKNLTKSDFAILLKIVYQSLLHLYESDPESVIVTDWEEEPKDTRIPSEKLVKKSIDSIPAWAKEETKPSYTAQEVGALPDNTIIPDRTSQLINDSGFLTSHLDISGKLDKIPVIDKTSDSSSSFLIDPNKMYMFGTRTSLTITPNPGESRIVNEYMFLFTSGSVATTLNVPSSVIWLKDPDIQTNKKYAVSIENNLGIIGEWSNE